MRRLHARHLPLLLAFILTAATGVCLHLSDKHGVMPQAEDALEVAHLCLSAACLLLAAQHVLRHGAWLRGLAHGRWRGRRVDTPVLLVVACLGAGTGLGKLFLKGMGLGRWHWALGLALIALTLVHVGRRWRALR